MPTTSSADVKRRRAREQPTNWTKAPNWLIYSTGLTPLERCVALAIISLFRPDDAQAKISLSDISRIVGPSRRTLIRLGVIEALKNYAGLTVDKKNGRSIIFGRLPDKREPATTAVVGKRPKDVSPVSKRPATTGGTGTGETVVTAVDHKNKDLPKDLELEGSPQGAFLVAPVGDDGGKYLNVSSRNVDYYCAACESRDVIDLNGLSGLKGMICNDCGGREICVPF